MFFTKYSKKLLKEQMHQLHVVWLKTQESLITITQKLDNMPTKQDLQTVIDEVNSNVSNIAYDIKRLSDRITSGMSDADAEDIRNQLKSLADRTKAVADITPDEQAPPTEPSTGGAVSGESEAPQEAGQ